MRGLGSLISVPGLSNHGSLGYESHNGRVDGVGGGSRYLMIFQNSQPSLLLVRLHNRRPLSNSLAPLETGGGSLLICSLTPILMPLNGKEASKGMKVRAHSQAFRPAVWMNINEIKDGVCSWK